MEAVATIVVDSIGLLSLAQEKEVTQDILVVVSRHRYIAKVLAAIRLAVGASTLEEGVVVTVRALLHVVAAAT